MSSFISQLAPPTFLHYYYIGDNDTAIYGSYFVQWIHTWRW